MAVVPVPDERLDRVAETLGAQPIVHETIEFHDIAGLVRGAHRGEGLGNQFLGNIRETDAIVHVVRVHDDAQVVHPEGRVDPARRRGRRGHRAAVRRPRAGRAAARARGRQAKSLDKIAVAEERWLREVVEALREGRAVRTVPPPEDAPGADVPAPGAHLEAGALRGQRGRGRAARAAGGAGGRTPRGAAPARPR